MKQLSGTMGQMTSFSDMRGLGCGSFSPKQLSTPLAIYQSDLGISTQQAAVLTSSNNNYFSLSGATFTDALTSFTLAGFFTVGSNGGLIAKWTNASQQQFLLQLSQALLFYLSNDLTTNNPASFTASTSLTNIPSLAGMQMHVCVTFNAGTVFIYLNSIAESLTQAGGTVPTTLTTSTAPLQIGIRGSLGNPLTSTMARWYFWAGVAFTQNQVNTLYNQGKGWMASNFSSNGLPTPTHGWDLNGNANDGFGSADMTNNNSTPFGQGGLLWQDQSGNGNIAGCTVVAPSVVTGVMNGHQILRFAGLSTPQYLFNGLINGANKPANWSLYALLSSTRTDATQSTSQQPVHGTFSSTSADDDIWALLELTDFHSSAPNGSFGLGYGIHAGLKSYCNTPTVFTANTPFRVSSTYTDGDDRVKAYYNAVQQTMTQSPFVGPPYATHCSGPAYPGTIGVDGTFINTLSIGPQIFSGDLGILAIYGINHSDSQRQQMEAYMKTWGNTG